MLGVAGRIEMIGGALVTVGLFTRAAAFIMSGEMAAAYWYLREPAGERLHAHPERRHTRSAILFRLLVPGDRRRGPLGASMLSPRQPA